MLRFPKHSVPSRYILAILVLVCVLPSLAQVPGQYNPVADPNAVVSVDQARFTVLTPQLIRMEWSPTKQFEDHASLAFINRHLPVPNFTVNKTPGVVVIKTDKLLLKYKTASGKFTGDNLSVTFTLDGKPVLWTPASADRGNLGGTTRTLDGVKGPTDIEPGLVSRDGWVVVDDAKRPLFDNSDWPWVMPRPTGERQDLYFFGYGHDYHQALSDFTKVAGKIPMPPRFAFGAWWSRYWAYTDREFMDLVEGFRSHDVPLDVLVIDMDWHRTYGAQDYLEKRLDQSGETLGWTGYSWDRDYFPNPPAFLNWVHKQGLKATVNMHPAAGVQPEEDPYPEMARAMGIDPATKKYVPFDIANKKFAENYLNILHHPLERQGIDFFWLDYQQKQTTSLPGLNPTFWLNYVHTSDMERRGERPLIFHRWGGLGNHRYQIGFSGDTLSVWESLAFQPYFTSTAANVGYGYWSHDIGGHMPGAIEPELYTRWVQFGIFSPVLRTHTTKNPVSERRIWAYPEPFSDIMRSAFQLRYSLIPYLYTASRQTYDTGVSFLRPMYYDYPDAPEAYDFKEQYLFGDSMMVAPVVAPRDQTSQLSTKSLWLPPGEWIEWFTGKHLRGPAKIERTFSLSEIPVYVKVGAIIPMQPKMQFTGEKPVDPLILTVFPGANGEMRVYEDEGNTLGYKSNKFAWTPVRYTEPDATTAKVEVQPVEGSYPGMLTERGYEVRLVQSWPPESVTVNGKPVAFDAEGKAESGWSYDGEQLMTTVRVPKTSVHDKIEVILHNSPELANDRALLDGAPGRMRRLRETIDIIPYGWPQLRVPEVLLHSAQTGRRIQLDPTTARAELQELQRNLPQIIEQVRTPRNDDEAKAHPEIRRRALLNLESLTK